MPILDDTRYKFTNSDFEFIRKLIEEHAGINLSSAKRELVYARLSRRLRLLNINSFSEYCARIKNGDEEELINCINSITTNVTYFFREDHHFEFLEKQIIPSFLEPGSPQSVNKRLRIWSAGCSTGEEPYSIEITLRKFRQLDSWDTRVLATDLSTKVLNIAQEGVFKLNQAEKMPEEALRRWFKKSNLNDSIKIKPELRQRIYFKHLNLNKTWKMKGPFDVIFCRNVVIYFDKETQKILFNRFADLLSDNGYLIIGHSETLNGISDRYRLISRTIYSKIK